MEPRKTARRGTLGPTFIYCPRSGDRVFAENPCSAVVVVKWSNGCRHVLGGIALSYWTAEPGNHWRNEARIAAASLIAACGGIAWDDQGSISLVVPRAAGVQVDGLMKKIAASAGKSVPADQNIPALILEGAPLRFAETGEFLISYPLIGHLLRPDWDITTARESVPAEGDDAEGCGPITRRWRVSGLDHLTNGSSGVVHAPESWGPPEILWSKEKLSAAAWSPTGGPVPPGGLPWMLRREERKS